jgi:hypothetical protein
VAYWQSNKGQALIKSLNGSASATKLSKWLATNFANLYGAAGFKLAGKTNAQVATFFETLSINDQEVLATALSVYASSTALAGGTMGKSAGLPVSTYGIASAKLNVGPAGHALGIADYSVTSIMQVLLDVNAESKGGVLLGKVANLSTRTANTALIVALFTNINKP